MRRALALLACGCTLLVPGLVAAATASPVAPTSSSIRAGGAQVLDKPVAAPTRSVVVPAARTSEPPTASELEDLAFIAREEGITRDEAVRRFGWQTAFGSVVDEVERRYPAAFAGSAMDTDATPGATIELTGAVPQDIKRVVRGVPVEVTVVGGLPHSESEVRRAVEVAHYAARADRTTGQVSTEYDETEGAVIVTAYDRVSVSARSAVDARSVVRSAERALDLEGLGDVPVRIGFGPVDGAGSETIRGGAIMTFPNTSKLACTSGWPVRSTDSRLQGLVTAEHCDNNLEYSGRDVLTYRNRVPKSRGDIQAMSSTEETGRAYYYGRGQYRKVYGVGRPREDQYLCKFGRATGRTCDNVRDLTTCRGDYCNLVSMDEHTSDNGDSGGPWGYGDTAYGVHSGVHTAFFRKRSQWTPLHNTLSYMRVAIKVARR